ncbi:MAG: hypothetical protein LBQ95_02555 [Lachnospiraceae bacterium]|jgi:molybdate transport repressor ModE-like protein|nr:hypothetical protein [Lachnospiraceae bacterium]
MKICAIILLKSPFFLIKPDEEKQNIGNVSITDIDSPLSFDPLEITDGLSPIQRIIMTLHIAGITDVYLPLNLVERKTYETHLARIGVTYLNEHKGSGSSLSLDNALGVVCRDYDRIIISSIAAPYFRAETVRALIENTNPFVIPTRKETYGWPIVLKKSVVESLLNAKDSMSAFPGAHASFSLDCTFQSVEDPGILPIAPAKAPPKDIVDSHTLHKLRPVIRIQLARESVFLGPGSRQLLDLINRVNSVRTACESMGISYSKGWKIIRTIEQQTAQTVVERKKGGKNGGEAHLSEYGLQLLNQYKAFEEECREAVTGIFEKHFPAAN